MSKKKQSPLSVDQASVPVAAQTDAETVAPAQIPAGTPPKMPIGECIDKMVECPECGKPAYVQNARGARTSTQVVSSIFWVLVKCKGSCGSKLRKVSELVTPMPDPKPPVISKTLGEVVGQFVKCPRDDCRARARAAWTPEEGHVIDCTVCQTRPYDSATVVEVLG